MRPLHALPQSFYEEIAYAKAILAPFTKRAYLVGGSVRDLLLNKPLHDMDIEVYDMTPEAFDALMQHVGAVGVGKSFFVYKLGNIDFSLPRKEHKNGIGHSAFDVQICHDEKEASFRRDFSMNAMMINIFTEAFLDFWGGARSIANKQIALIDKERFKEDSLRVLRAVQFSARFGFKIEPKTLEVMRAISLKDLSHSRILWEFEKLFCGSFLHYGLFYMYKLDLFEKCLFSAVPKCFLSIARELIRTSCNFQKTLQAYYFFYIVANRLGHHPLAWFKRLEAPNHYLNACKHQPFFKGKIDDKMLYETSLDIPLCSWLGNYREGVEKRAKELGIWAKAFDGGIGVQEVIKDGFKDKAIGIELKKRRIEKMNQLCKA